MIGLNNVMIWKANLEVILNQFEHPLATIIY